MQIEHEIVLKYLIKNYHTSKGRKQAQMNWLHFGSLLYNNNNCKWNIFLFYLKSDASNGAFVPTENDIIKSCLLAIPDTIIDFYLPIPTSYSPWGINCLIINSIAERLTFNCTRNCNFQRIWHQCRFLKDLRYIALEGFAAIYISRFAEGVEWSERGQFS